MALESGPPSSLPVNPDTKVDISSLTWEDKERVLRLLFGKINNIQVLQCYNIDHRAKIARPVGCIALLYQGTD